MFRIVTISKPASTATKTVQHLHNIALLLKNPAGHQLLYNNRKLHRGWISYLIMDFQKLLRRKKNFSLLCAHLF